jgi:chemotaxis protein methyltransferase CheR
MKRFEDKYIEQFKDLVSSQIGLFVRQGDLESFRRTLLLRMKSLDFVEPGKYYSFLKTGTKEGEDEWRKLIILFTTGESYFFRDKGHFFLLQNSILPRLIENKKNQQTLRVWSAGCATGEEPFSIAILIDILLPNLKGWDVFIIGTDINEEALARAKRGIFSEWSFRMVDEAIREKYFKRRGAEWEIDARIKSMVQFQYGNLMEDRFFSQIPGIGNMDLIICRNVFIYFEKETVSLVFNKFIEKLNTDGYLITGHGELYGQELSNLHRIMYPEAIIYKKITEFTSQDSDSTLVPKFREEKKNRKIMGKPLSKPALPVPQKSKKTPQEPIFEIEELIANGRYTEAIKKGESFLNQYRDNYNLLYLLAQVHANSGDYEKAEDFCKKAINLNANAADPFFLLAHISEIRGSDQEAKELFRKAIYLNPDYIAAYLELGGIYDKENDLSRAIKVRTTAIELLKSMPSVTSVKPYDMTAGELLKYIDNLGRGNDGSVMPLDPVARSGR